MANECWVKGEAILDAVVGWTKADPEIHVLFSEMNEETDFANTLKEKYAIRETCPYNANLLHAYRKDALGTVDIDKLIAAFESLNEAVHEMGKAFERAMETLNERLRSDA